MKMFKGNSLDTPVMNFSDEGSLSYKFEHLALIFFEEVSMVGCKKFQNIHSRIEQIKGKLITLLALFLSWLLETLINFPHLKTATSSIIVMLMAGP